MIRDGGAWSVGDGECAWRGSHAGRRMRDEGSGTSGRDGVAE